MPAQPAPHSRDTNEINVGLIATAGRVSITDSDRDGACHARSTAHRSELCLTPGTGSPRAFSRARHLKQFCALPDAEMKRLAGRAPEFVINDQEDAHILVFSAIISNNKSSVWLGNKVKSSV